MSAATHPFAPEEIMAFVDGELSADRAQLLSSHFNQCAECQEIRESFRSASQKITAWTIGVPQWLDESAIVSDTEKASSKGKTRGGFRGLGELLSRNWI